MAWKSFWFQIFIYFSFSFSDRDRLQYTLFDEATGLSLPEHQWRMSAIRGPRILLDLVCTHFLAHFVLFHFLSSVYISSISAQTEASSVALSFCFVLRILLRKYKVQAEMCLSSASSRLSAWFLKSVFQNRDSWDRFTRNFSMRTSVKNKKKPLRFCWRNLVKNPSKYLHTSFSAFRKFSFSRKLNFLSFPILKFSF